MKKTLLTLILIFQIGILTAQKTQSELLIGTWRFEKVCDLRTEEEKSEFAEIPWCPPETENGTGHADRIFKENNEFEFYMTKTHSDFGIYQYKNGKMTIQRRIAKEQSEKRPDLIKSYVKKNLIHQKSDGYYYYKPLDLELKVLTENHMEFGTEKYYAVWRRIK